MIPLPVVIGASLMAYGARFVRNDIALAVEELREERDELERRRNTDEPPPLLQVTNLDFAYGNLQVLFDVHVEVVEGETLALLGTNGAGKSTLLKVISGLEYPTRGVVRLDGRTITYSDAEHRVRSGIVQMPGGSATFPSMTVRDNLLAGAYIIGGRRESEAKIDEVVELFPKLHERMSIPAGMLSGGEQQQLGLAKAMLLQPRLLCIDEFSLGLAPTAVADLLTVLEALRRTGLTMILVEQSVNLALSVADRAIFMEKGRIRFEGAAADLLERDDLLRAVFLHDAAGGGSESSS
jgi:ABC-type branched-subunit amino acid transport system ATPase component